MLGRSTKRKNGQPGWLQKRKTALTVLAVFIFAAILFVRPSHVAHAVEIGLNFASATGLSTFDLRTYVGRIVRYFLGLLGIIAVTLMIYAGYIWMTSAGNPEKIDKAKKIMQNAVIGLVIIVSAYAIVEFVFRALTGDLGAGSSSGPNTRLTTLFSGNRGNDALGNGIIDYHYPEPGQTGVPRNTKISITFKKPLVRASVIKHYDDNDTFTVADDHLCAGDPPCPGDPLVTSLVNPVFELNTDNIKLIPNEGLAPAGSGSLDAQFDNRYPDAAALVDPAPTAKLTTVTEPIDPLQYQTLVFKPVTAIGSPSTNMNYRVALRGGDNGIKVWSAPPGGGEPLAEVGFGRTFADGGYFWSFTTSTLLDTTPPRIVALVPMTTPTPGTPPGSILDRNQLLQIYFDEAVDPTTASGVIGAGGGFSNVEVKAQCLPTTFPGSCVFNGGSTGTVDGTLFLGNRYRTAEFKPSAECEGVAENSCGEKVYCLPKNVGLTVRTLAATVGSTPPAASVDNGVEDMVGNSLDGNNDGTAQGPQAPAQPGGRALDYYRNDPPTDPAVLATVSDTARWQYNVGSNIDLVVPKATGLDPNTPPPEETDYALGGPSNVPPSLEPSVTWSKTMSIGSLRTGGFDELTGQYTSSTSTLVLRSKECAKNSADACPGPPPSSCPCTEIDPPGFFVDAGLPFEDPPGSGTFVTKTKLVHPFRPFYTANDLGYTETDIIVYPDNIPVYAPIARAQIKDTKQNCFWPSVYKPAPAASECTLGAGQLSCCQKDGTADSALINDCAP
ncbi:MAG TPA: pilin [Candidatus Eisenbacteria bacterium]|nr:pilin [Candidatus Eisenbacteria bacterium]